MHQGNVGHAKIREFKECVCLGFCNSRTYKGCRGCPLVFLRTENADSIRIIDMLKGCDIDENKRREVKWT